MTTKMNERYERVSLNKLEDNPFQSRVVFDRDELRSLADSIKKLDIIEPLVARPHPKKPNIYQLAVGARRKQAAHLAGLKEVSVIIRDLDDKGLQLYGLAENWQRVDLTDEEKEKALHDLWEKHYMRPQLRSHARKDANFPNLHAMSRDLGMPISMLHRYLHAYETRKQVSSTLASHELASLSTLDKNTIKTLVKAREREKLSGRELAKALPTIREHKMREAQVAAAKSIIKAKEQAQEHVDSVIKEVHHAAHEMPIVIAKEVSIDERRLKRIIEVADDIKMYLLVEYIFGIKDARMREKALNILHETREYLDKEIADASKRVMSMSKA